MKIRSINITEFGGLKNFSLDLSESLNIITGDNESGKSTILLFISYMLYGFAKKGANASLDKARSISWEGSRAEGQLELLHDGKSYRITRALKGKTSTSVFKVFELESGEQIECDCPADLFLKGVSRETFESCCLCGQLRASSINGTQVSETLSNLSIGADESVNADAVIESVRKARKEYKHERGRGGAIDDIADEIEDVCHKKLIASTAIEAQKSNKETLDKKMRELEAATERLTRLKKAKERQAILLELGRFEAHHKTEKELKDTKERLDALSVSFGFNKKEPDALELGEMRHIGLEYQAKKDELLKAESAACTERSKIDMNAKENAERLILSGGKNAALVRVADTRKGIVKKLYIAIVTLALAVISFALCIISPLVAIAGVAFGGVAATFFILYQKAKKSLTDVASGRTAEENIEYCFMQYDLFCAEAEAEKKTLEAKRTAEEALGKAQTRIVRKLEEYSRANGGAPLEALYILISDAKRYIEQKSELTQKAAVCESLISSQKKELADKDESKLLSDLSATEPDASFEAIDLDGEMLVCNSLEKRLTDEITSLRIKIESAADNESALISLEQKHSELLSKKAELEDRYEVLGIALDALTDARDNLQRAFAPEVRRKAGELLARISHNKYTSLFLSQKLEASVDSAGLPRSAETLSGGTSDALYIALRLALIDSIFGTDAPLIFDETLSQVDDKRATEVLSLINDFTSRGGQSLFFTCHKREAALCKEHGIAHKSIVI